ncbi:c-type cytochrome biogenesis protein CcmI [Actibacterium sp. D379-3]
MTLLWIAITGAALICALWMAWPFLRRTEVELHETDQALSIYRDQADEVHRDLKAGLISAAEFDAAQQEIEARALKAARKSVRGMSVSHRSPVFAATLVVLAAGAALAGYAGLGNPALPDLPLAQRKAQALMQQAEAGDIDSRIQLLIQTTRDNPQSFEDWWLLARSYAAIGDNASAADAYRHAAELSDNNPSVLSAYGEAMTLANGNKVPQAARLIFEQVLARGTDPRARYYVALAKAQAQDFEGALHGWAALAADSSPDAPWMGLVRRDIVNMARFLKRDVTAYLPDATAVEIAAAGSAGGGADIGSAEAMTARAVGLELALAGDPADYKGWIELAQIRSALGDDEGAARTIADARAHFAAAPFVLGKIDDAATALGLDLLAQAPGVSGPDAADIAAAQNMSADEQADLIAGMVAGLAAKLEENPDNPDGWIMLVRSYAQLGKADKAQATYSAARAHFAEKAAILARLSAEAGPAVTTP